ncbi:MAG: PRC-barrel domain-containing protein [Methanosphaera sp.]|uniref:PRC-barrel domain-containing protein n=1 Tax=Methanosphaera sp. ISO3-F5 TaxID=1452353 RepID=UPI002B261521|nr:PRC-barrel domain-containing protein [Methanosphaera sp. ISO3-F5]MBR0473094.1 PRC-barrel domain-containing protein [Methanosphaera sp.]WQH64576.1 PRC-barrel domain-containing protein [Methanosphaera sp. ISO3-F5]
MVNLSKFYDLNIYDTEGKYIGKVNEVVLNIKKGRISFFKTKAITEDNRNVGLRDVLRNSMRLVPEEEDVNPVRTEGIIDIPYEVVIAVNDIILVDQVKLAQFQTSQNKRINAAPQKRPMVKKPQVQSN